MKRLALAVLSLLPLLAACRHAETAPDYDSVRQRSEQSHQSLDGQRADESK